MTKDFYFRSFKFLLFAFISSLLLLPVNAEEPPLKKVSFIAMWKPQAQFAGYYMAQEKGFYRDAGLDVTILRSGPEFPPQKMLAGKKADFGVLWLSQALKQREEGVPLVNIAQIVRRSGHMLVQWRSDGAAGPVSLNGKKVSLWENDLGLLAEAFLKQRGLEVIAVPQSYTVNLFLMRGVDACQAMWYNEYHTILSSGVNENELKVFFLREHGMDFPEDGIYALRETVDADPQTAGSFVKASLKGWLYAFANPDETVETVMRLAKEAHVPASRAHQQWMLSRMKDLVLPEEMGEFGELEQDDYGRLGSFLLDAGALSRMPAFNDFYRGGKPDDQK